LEKIGFLECDDALLGKIIFVEKEDVLLEKKSDF
jgi:hypothetical protein